MAPPSLLNRILYNAFYYKTWITSFLTPESSAVAAYKRFETPHLPPKVPEWEIEFDKKVPYNLIKLPYAPHIEGMKKKIAEGNLPKKITRVPDFPEFFYVLEYLPDPSVPRRPETIICVHGWDGRSLNFFKFITKLQAKGFRVLAPDFPRHGKTEAKESGCHVFGHSLNVLVNYVKGPCYVLAHSLGNGAFCVNYAISTPEEKAYIRKYVGIGVPDKFTNIMDIFAKMIGLASRAYPAFVKVNSEMLGFDVYDMEVSKILTNFDDIPLLLIHDENDKELAYNVSKVVGESLVNPSYRIKSTGRLHPSFYTSKGLGHRRIIRDDGIVDRVVEFFSEDLELSQEKVPTTDDTTDENDDEDSEKTEKMDEENVKSLSDEENSEKTTKN